VNNNDYAPVVNHIDLIAGDITGEIDSLSPDYTKATNDSTKVIASFTAADWEQDEDGYNTIVYRIENANKSMYFRLRGTNLACGVQSVLSGRGMLAAPFLVIFAFGFFYVSVMSFMACRVEKPAETRTATAKAER
jgi:hypothetical protein